MGTTQARLIELLDYCQETGVFTWKAGPREGRPAGCSSPRGELLIRVDDQLVAAHRLAWLYAYGEPPTGRIIHKNHNRSDNRISNLCLSGAAFRVVFDADGAEAASQLREAMSYDPNTGRLRWRIGRHRIRPGDDVGSSTGPHRGCRYVKINGRSHQCHRLAWLHFYGEWPEWELRHENGDGEDNRIANLSQIPGDGVIEFDPGSAEAPQRIREILDYDPDSGVFRWRSHGRNTRAGGVAGTVANWGYMLIRLGRKNYRAHRLAWLWVYGEWPSDQLDHINRDRKDNRIANLRKADQSDNFCNKQGRIPGRLKGTTKIGTRWRAGITRHSQYHNLGTFDTEQEAHEAYCQAAAKLHGAFACTESRSV